MVEHTDQQDYIITPCYSNTPIVFHSTTLSERLGIPVEKKETRRRRSNSQSSLSSSSKKKKKKKDKRRKSKPSSPDSVGSMRSQATASSSTTMTMSQSDITSPLTPTRVVRRMSSNGSSSSSMERRNRRSSLGVNANQQQDQQQQQQAPAPIQRRGSFTMGLAGSLSASQQSMLSIGNRLSIGSTQNTTSNVAPTDPADRATKAQPRTLSSTQKPTAQMMSSSTSAPLQRSATMAQNQTSLSPLRQRPQAPPQEINRQTRTNNNNSNPSITSAPIRAPKKSLAEAVLQRVAERDAANVSQHSLAGALGLVPSKSTEQPRQIRSTTTPTRHVSTVSSNPASTKKKKSLSDAVLERLALMEDSDDDDDNYFVSTPSGGKRKKSLADAVLANITKKKTKVKTLGDALLKKDTGRSSATTYCDLNPDASLYRPTGKKKSLAEAVLSKMGCDPAPTRTLADALFKPPASDNDDKPSTLPSKQQHQQQQHKAPPLTRNVSVEGDTLSMDNLPSTPKSTNTLSRAHLRAGLSNGPKLILPVDSDDDNNNGAMLKLSSQNDLQRLNHNMSMNNTQNIGATKLPSKEGANRIDTNSQRAVAMIQARLAAFENKPLMPRVPSTQHDISPEKFEPQDKQPQTEAISGSAAAIATPSMKKIPTQEANQELAEGEEEEIVQVMDESGSASSGATEDFKDTMVSESPTMTEDVTPPQHPPPSDMASTVPAASVKEVLAQDDEDDDSDNVENNTEHEEKHANDQQDKDPSNVSGKSAAAPVVISPRSSIPSKKSQAEQPPLGKDIILTPTSPASSPTKDIAQSTSQDKRSAESLSASSSKLSAFFRPVRNLLGSVMESNNNNGDNDKQPPSNEDGEISGGSSSDDHSVASEMALKRPTNQDEGLSKQSQEKNTLSSSRNCEHLEADVHVLKQQLQKISGAMTDLKNHLLSNPRSTATTTCQQANDIENGDSYNDKRHNISVNVNIDGANKSMDHQGVMRFRFAELVLAMLTLLSLMFIGFFVMHQYIEMNRHDRFMPMGIAGGQHFYPLDKQYSHFYSQDAANRRAASFLSSKVNNDNDSNNEGRTHPPMNNINQGSPVVGLHADDGNGKSQNMNDYAMYNDDRDDMWTHRGVYHQQQQQHYHQHPNGLQGESLLSEESTNATNEEEVEIENTTKRRNGRFLHKIVGSFGATKRLIARAVAQ